MPYRKPEVVEVSLDAVDCPELWVKFKDPSALPAGEQLRLQRAQFVLMRVQRRQEPPPAEDDWTILAVHDAVEKLLVEWNLPYPEGHPRAGEVIPLGKPDQEPDPLGPLPPDVYWELLQEVGGRLFRPPKRA